jgi:hypothetical protein
MKATAGVFALYKLEGISSHERRPAGTASPWELARHGETRVAPTVEFLEDVMRTSRMTSSETRSYHIP